MRYISSSEGERQQLLESIGVKDIEELFSCIPADVRLKRKLNLPNALSESELLSFFKDLAAKNANMDEYSYFIGAGVYNHFIPLVINALISRAEFLTSYTPYQAEISQGTLQSIFEYQTMICQLTGMQVANASMYDGSTAMAEAVIMAHRITDRPKVITISNIHPEYRQVLNTYARNLGIRAVNVPHDSKTGRVNLDGLKSELDSDVAAVVVQSPNFFGLIEEIADVAEMIHGVGGISVVVIPEPLSLGILKSPGELGVDIVVGEGQPFGIPASYGGPFLGFFASLDQYKRSLPGRIVGQALDSDGQVGYVLTLATREQHIRREKATSNICTNEGLCALMATIYLCVMGKQGIREVAMQNVQKAHYAARSLISAGKCTLRFGSPFFNEFVLDLPSDPHPINEKLTSKKIIGGLPLSRFYPEMQNSMLLCVTEQTTRHEIDRFVDELNRLL